jgi:membrane protease YdiL (CAAX protease family)
MNDIARMADMNGRIPPQIERVSRGDILRLGKWFTLALCLIAAVLPLPFERPGVWSALGLAGLFTWQTLLSSVLGLIIGVFVAALIIHWRPLRVVAEQPMQLVAWETLRTSDYVLVALMAAVSEELLFRGALQPLISLLPMAAIFGLLHFTSIAHVILAGLLGLLLGWLYQWSGSLWPSMAAHFWVDLATGLLLARSLKPGVKLDRGD